MSEEQLEWEEQTVARYREHLKKFREQLGEQASIVEIEKLLVEHENTLMRDTLDALSEGVSPPKDSGGS